MTKPILVTGGTGQVATALAEAGHEAVHLVGRPVFDFDRPDTLDAAVRDVRPWLVVNAAAYTAVDAAEDDPEAAYRANRDGPGRLARACAQADVPLIHISTDYVFDGSKGVPYVETDPTVPTGVYGASKLAGEQAALTTAARVVILRTSWLYGPTGNNFVRTMLRLGATRDRLQVVGDQRGCPTTSSDLAAAILAIATRLQGGWRDEYGGLFHVAGSGETTWHGLAVATFAEAARHGMRVPDVKAITTSEYPTKAKRPADSRLNCNKLERVFGVQLPTWQASLARVLDRIYA